MNAYLLFVFLGVVQGLTEFLPVSSSGHLILLESLAGVNPPGVLTEVVMHLATLLAVVIYYRHDLGAMLGLRSVTRLRSPGAYVAFLALATAATVGVILPFRHLLEQLAEGRPALVALAFTFAVTSAMMFGLDKLLEVPRPRLREVTSLGWLPVVVIGLAQGVAALPGISRSGATIFMGVLLGLRRDEAARFSFLLFIPAAVLATGYELVRMESGGLAFPRELAGPVAAGFLAALVTGLLAIHLLLLILQKSRLRYFGVYLLLLALLVWGLVL